MTIENFALVDFRGSRFVCGAALDNLLKIFTFQSHLKSDLVLFNEGENVHALRLTFNERIHSVSLSRWHA